MKIETVWSCEVCGNSAMGIYDGPNDAETRAAWAQKAHDRMEPNCPYKFKMIAIHPMDPPSKEERSANGHEA